jgi:cytochrome c biogenesis protein
MSADEAERDGRRKRRRRSTSRVLLEFLGSMRLAIILLVVLAVASVIGTVLQQNEPYADYRIEFGAFWFEVFRVLGLYNVYSASWFLAILVFLVVSTLVCVSRHIPSVWREMTRYRERMRVSSLTALRNHRRWQLDVPAETAASAVDGVLGRAGYRQRTGERGETRVTAAMKGRANRLGYLMTHLAIVVIGIGALVDANLGLKWRTFLGDLNVVTANRSMSQMPPDSRLPVGTTSFRGTVYIAEGQSAGGVFLPVRDGHVLQDLPFQIALKDFRIRHYDSGQPKSFESDLVIRDERLEQPLEKTISVNDPLHYRGYAIYQADFNDGGSRLDMRLWPLRGPSEGTAIEGRVGEQIEVTVNDTQRTIELTDFSLFNVRPERASDDGSTSRDPRDVDQRGEFRNVGPSFKYKLRQPSGEAREFHNYLTPLRLDGASYYLSGVRTSPGEPFRYLRIPADQQGSPALFMALLDRLNRPAQVRQAAEQAARQLLRRYQGEGADDLVRRVAGTAEGMIERLRRGGFGAVEEHLTSQFGGENVSNKRRETLVRFSRTVLQRTLMQLYRESLASERDVSTAALQLDQRDRRFFADALEAVSGLATYREPFWLQLKSFEHIQASGLQITRSPGKDVVYAGFGLLIGGVFVMFYVPHRRIWALVIPGADKTEVVLAGVSNRHSGAFAGEFSAVAEALEQDLEAVDDNNGGKGADGNNA